MKNSKITIAQSICDQLAIGPNNQVFKPTARYYSDADFLLYINEDCSYRADRVDSSLTVLWHPTQDYLVGIKLKGFLALFKRILDTNGVQLNKTQKSLKLSAFLRLLEHTVQMQMLGGMLKKIETERLRERYEKAIELAGEEDITIDNMEDVLAAA